MKESVYPGLPGWRMVMFVMDYQHLTAESRRSLDEQHTSTRFRGGLCRRHARAPAADLIGTGVALRDEPAAATETMVPTFTLRSQQVAPRRNGAVRGRGKDLAAAAKLRHIAWAAVRAAQQEGHRSLYPSYLDPS